MKIKPLGWVFDATGETCCLSFTMNAKMDADDVMWTNYITTDGKNVFFRGTMIKDCPYCGKKIELEKVEGVGF